jgi:hypothetical protein
MAKRTNRLTRAEKIKLTNRKPVSKYEMKKKKMMEKLNETKQKD